LFREWFDVKSRNGDGTMPEKDKTDSAISAVAW